MTTKEKIYQEYVRIMGYEPSDSNCYMASKFASVICFDKLPDIRFIIDDRGDIIGIDAIYDFRSVPMTIGEALALSQASDEEKLITILRYS